MHFNVPSLLVLFPILSQSVVTLPGVPQAILPEDGVIHPNFDGEPELVFDLGLEIATANKRFPGSGEDPSFAKVKSQYKDGEGVYVASSDDNEHYDEWHCW